MSGIVKQPVDVRFAQGLDQKPDPKQVTLGNFLSLTNAVFDKGGRLTKRNGYEDVTTLPANTNAAILSSFQDSLIAVGSKLQAYSASSETWTQMGLLTPLTLNVFPVARPNANITQSDTAVASSPLTGQLGLACTVFTDANGYFYQITDAATGATIIPAKVIPTSATINGVPKVFVLGRYFAIVFSATTGGTERLQMVAVSLTNPASVTTAVDLTTTYSNSATTSWDGVVANNSLYVAYNASTGGGAVNVTYVSSTLVQGPTVAFAGEHGTIFGLSADTTGSSAVIYVTYWNTTPQGRVLAVSPILTTILAPTTFDAHLENIGNLAPYAANGQVKILYEVTDTYGYDAALPNNRVQYVTVTQAGSVSAVTTLTRGVGLASKSFLFEGQPTVLVLYSGKYENGYFLMDTTTNRVICKLAYGNAIFAPTTGVGYLTTGLPGAWQVGTTTYVGYLQASSIQPVNKTQGQSTTGVYLQAGASVAAFDSVDVPETAEIGGTLIIAAGLVSLYDGSEVVEQGFNVWPDEVEVTTSAAGGLLSAQTYFYQVTYEWTDAQGYLHRSAPSVPVGLVTTGATSTNTVKVPTLRLTQKTGVRIVLYRWSTAQQTYYLDQFINNDPTTDFVTFTDTLADASIIGNAILYTTGGVVENIGAPASNILTLFRSRLLLLNAEDQNSVWYSKVVQEATPVEMSDVFTIFCSPSIGAQGSTGPITALSAMDDKAIMFKANGMYYETGQGPDATGASNDFQDPVYITSSVGCANPQSVVLPPMGLIFQSNKGRWMLGRDLATTYVGAPVDDLNTLVDSSAVAIPGTNQVRISTGDGPTLMYDYFYGQWGTFSTQIVSSCIVQGIHVTLDKYGRIRQEEAGTYVDGGDPVLISFTTGWGDMAGLQGYQRAYFLLFEGQYFSPFNLSVGIAYDYVPVVTQQISVSPLPPNGTFGSDPTFGSSYVFGGPNSGQFKPRLFLQRQRCQSFQVTVQESYDPSFGVPAGQGFNLSGMTAVVGIKRGFRTNSATTSFG